MQTWLRNCWQVAAFGSEIGSALLPRTVLNEKIVLFRTADGLVTAFEDRCAHRGLPLSLGTLLGDVLQCGYHGLCFDASGQCIAVPGQPSIPAQARVRTYPIVEQYQLVWIWLGDPELAEPSLVPNIFWMTDPEWACSSGYHHIEADFRLINDNLLDLSHETFVHPETIGNRAVAESKVTAKIIDGREVRVHRMMENVVPPPMYASAFGFTTNINRWHTTVYAPPGIVVIYNGAKPAGATNAPHDTERRVINLITPETDTTSHYFWSIARAFRLDDSELTEYIRKQIYVTFNQDKLILEAQQRSLGDGDAFPMPIHLDAGPILGRRLLQTAIDRERAHLVAAV